jgi:hypothetical protein
MLVLLCATVGFVGVTGDPRPRSGRPPTRKEAHMKYMLQVRFDAAAAAIAGMRDEQQQAIAAEFRAFAQLPAILEGHRLQPTHTAATVHVQGGETHATDGPPGDPRSALDGYYLCDVPDLEAATALAARIPVARLGGTVEIRPLVEG